MINDINNTYSNVEESSPFLNCEDFKFEINKTKSGGNDKLSLLGEGSFAKVVKAIYIPNGEIFAIKIVRLVD